MSEYHSLLIVCSTHSASAPNPNRFSKNNIAYLQDSSLCIFFVIIDFPCIPLENNVTSVGLVANLDARRQSLSGAGSRANI
jgi:hypothetical protein